MHSESPRVTGVPPSDYRQIDLLPVLTLVLWLTCLSIGLVGHYVIVAPVRPLPVPKATEATTVKVTLTDTSAAPVLMADQPPAVPDFPQIPSPPPPPVAVPITPAVAFANPVKGQVRIVGPSHASATVPRPDAVFQQISYGIGQGRQPKPDYPLEAQLAGQDGTVIVRFIVGTDGTITSVNVQKPCEWPLLNQAAARSIRETWNYPAGPVRYFEVSITYRHK